MLWRYQCPDLLACASHCAMLGECPRAVDDADAHHEPASAVAYSATAHQQPHKSHSATDADAHHELASAAASSVIAHQQPHELNTANAAGTKSAAAASAAASSADAELDKDRRIRENLVAPLRTSNTGFPTDWLSIASS